MSCVVLTTLTTAVRDGRSEALDDPLSRKFFRGVASLTDCPWASHGHAPSWAVCLEKPRMGSTAVGQPAGRRRCLVRRSAPSSGFTFLQLRVSLCSCPALCPRHPSGQWLVVLFCVPECPQEDSTSPTISERTLGLFQGRLITCCCCHLPSAASLFVCLPVCLCFAYFLMVHSHLTPLRKLPYLEHLFFFSRDVLAVP